MIKFRYVLKNNVTGKIYYKWYSLSQIEKVGLKGLFDIGEDKIINRDRFTGLKDKNGTDIYEGDKVKWEQDTELSDREGEDVVEFINGAFFPCAYTGEGEYYSVDIPICEVISNIYDKSNV